jgi:acetylornithine deacetylase/succinyl-diaminopimelate desuccinylase-like protein
MKNTNLVLFRLLKYSFRRIKLDNTIVFHKFAALHSSVVPHERTNVTTEAVVEALYSCRLIIATFLPVTLCFSRITMPKTLIVGNGKIIDSLNKKSIEKRKKTAIISIPCEEIVDHKAPTYVEEQPDTIDGRRVVELKVLGQQLCCVSCKEYVDN